MDNRISNLISAISKLRNFNTTLEDINYIKSCLNLLFGTDGKCINFYYTINTDKLPFGCVVMPVMKDYSVNNFLIAGEDTRITDYEVEIDSKMFDYGLTDEEVAEIVIYNIYHLIKDFTPCNIVREFIDDFFTTNANQLTIRASVQYEAILKLGLYDALVQVSTCLNLPDDIVNDPFLESLELPDFKEALDKLYKQIPGCENEVLRQPNLSLLNWALRLYDNVNTERIPALHLLNKAKSLTASTLYTNKINAAINALNRIDTDFAINESVEMVFNESKRRGGLLASLRYSGLRDIENDLFEFQIRAKNAESEQDVMYALKQINARLAILDDYIRQNPDDPDIDRWVNVKLEYMEIRDILAKKKLHKKAYGIFVDYDALDKLDEE